MEDEPQAVAGMVGPIIGSYAKTIPAANATDAAIEQFQYLADHTESGFCVPACHDCALLLAVRRLLLERFAVTKLPIPIDRGRR